MRGYILTLLFLAGTATPCLHAATIIKNDTTGIVIFRKAGFDSLDKPLPFRRITQDQAYFNVITPDNLLVHIETDRVVKVVFFIDPASLPTKFEPEDLAVIKAKIDELHALVTRSPDAAKLAAAHLQYLQNLYDSETGRYKQAAEIAAQKFSSEQEKATFDKKCDLLWLALQASAGDLGHSEEIVKEMEPLAPRSEKLTGVLARWNEEKNHALQLAGEYRDLLQAAQKAHPESLKAAATLGDIPDFPGDLKDKIAALETRFEQFRSSVSIPQTALYCQNEIPAVFLMNELPKLDEKIKARDYKEAASISQKALEQLRREQFTDPYKPVYDTFKNHSDLVDDIRTRFFRQLARAQSFEGNITNRELLVEYQKAFDIIPDPAVAEKIRQLQEKIKNQ